MKLNRLWTIPLVTILGTAAYAEDGIGNDWGIGHMWGGGYGMFGGVDDDFVLGRSNRPDRRGRAPVRQWPKQA